MPRCDGLPGSLRIGPIAAILLCVPAGVIFIFLPSLIIGTIRNLPGVSVRAVSFSSLWIGPGFAIWAYTWDASTAVRALGVIARLGYVTAGYGIYRQAASAALVRQMSGEELQPDDVEYLRDLG